MAAFNTLTLTVVSKKETDESKEALSLTGTAENMKSTLAWWDYMMHLE